MTTLLDVPLEELGADEDGASATPATPVAHLAFVPSDPPRTSRFAIYADPNVTGPSVPARPGFFDSTLEVVWPTTSSVRRRSLAAAYMPLHEAVPVLATGKVPDDVPAIDPATWEAWGAVVTAGLLLVSRGRLFPAASPAGFDAWRAGPLDAADHRLLDDLAAALPPEAHCVQLGTGSPLRVASPSFLVRALWDAVADVMVRTPAAAVVIGGEPPAAAGARRRRGHAGTRFASSEPQPATDLAPWLAEAGGGLEGGVRVGLRIVLGHNGPADGELGDADLWGDGSDGSSAVVQVTSAVDPSLVVDAADLFNLPTIVRSRLGEDADTELLLALRRGARAWPRLASILEERVPARLALDKDDVEDLLTGGAADALAAAGIEILWPSDLLVTGLTLRASIESPPKVDGTSGFTLAEMVEFRWRVALGGEELTDAELDGLADAKRSIVRIRGRWVAVDPAIIQRARERRAGRMTGAEALAAMLAGEISVDGEPVTVVAGGAIASFVERLRGVGEDTNAPIGPPPGLAGDLRPYQQRGVSWLHDMCALGLGGCLADDMGLGKTIQLIGLHLHRRAAASPLPGRRRRGAGAAPATTLITCPTSLLGNWARELARFAPGVPVRRYYGAGRTLDALQPGEVVITSYGVARRDRAALGAARFSLVVADEAQHAKNPHSETARSIREIGGGPDQVRVALTGTPVENRLSELWSILDWTTPGLLGPLERFQRDIATPVEQRRDPDVTARLARTVRPFLLRRRKTDPAVAPDLPPRTVTDVPVGLTVEQVTLYEAEVREALDAISGKSGIKRQGLVFRMLTVLKQICNHPAHYLHQPGPLAGRSGKMDALEELLPVIVAEGDSVLVFSQYVEMCALLEARLDQLGIRSLFLHGGIPARRRDQLVAEFQAGVAPVFLLSLKAGGVGLNLTRATHVIHYDRWWNPAVEDQATDRAHRIGQDRPVQVHRLLAEGTLEDRIATLLEHKRELADKVVGEGEGWIAKMSDAELADLVQLGSPDRTTEGPKRGTPARTRSPRR